MIQKKNRNCEREVSSTFISTSTTHGTSNYHITNLAFNVIHQLQISLYYTSLI